MDTIEIVGLIIMILILGFLMIGEPLMFFIKHKVRNKRLESLKTKLKVARKLKLAQTYDESIQSGTRAEILALTEEIQKLEA